MKKYNLKIDIPFNDKVFIFISKIPLINKLLKNKESRIEDILSDYIGDFVVCCYRDSNLEFDDYDLSEFMHRKCLKIDKNFTFYDFEKKVNSIIETDREIAEWGNE